MSDQRIELAITLENGQLKIAAKDAEQHIERIGKASKNAGDVGAKGLSGIERALKAISTVAKASVILQIAQAIYEVGKAALKGSSDLEKNRMAFETMLGSASKAKKLMDDIQKMAANTPFETPGLVDAAKRLIAFGIAEDEVIEKMTHLGDASMGNQEVFERLADAYGKTAAKGKATMEEMNRFLEAGVPILDTLAQKYNTNTGAIIQMVENGKIGFKDIDSALTTLTTNGGKFAGLMEKQAQSLGGKFSTLVDNVMMSLTEMGDQMAPTFKALIDAFTDMTSEGSVFKDVLSGIATVATTVANTLMIIGYSIAQMVYGIQEAKAYLDNDTEAMEEARAKGEAARAKGDAAAGRIAGEKTEDADHYYVDGHKVQNNWTDVKWTNEGDAGGQGIIGYTEVQEDGTKLVYERGKLVRTIAPTGKRGISNSTGGSGAGGKKLTREQYEKEFGKIGEDDITILQAEYDQKQKLLKEFLDKKIITQAEYDDKSQKMLKDLHDKEIQSYQKAAEKKMSIVSHFAGFAQQQMQTLSSIFSMQDEENEKALTKKHQLGASLIEYSRQQSLAIAGVTEENQIQQYNKEISELEKKLAAEKNIKEKASIKEQLTEKKKQRDKALIEQEAARAKEALDLQMELAKRKMAAESFKRQQAMSMAQTIIQSQVAGMSAMSGMLQTMPGIPGIVAGSLAVATINSLAGWMVGMIARQSPPLATGGYIPGSEYGKTYTVAEAGKGEVVLPVDNPEVIAKIQNAIGANGGDVYTTINLDGRTIAEVVTPHQKRMAYARGANNFSYQSAY